MLNERERGLYGRQALLPEIGAAGQRKLCDSRLRVAGELASPAAAVMLDYLRRAGCGVICTGDEHGHGCGATPLPEVLVPSAAEVERLAGGAHLREAAAAVLGAFAAVEVIKDITGAGTRGGFPQDFVLSSQESE